MFERKKLGWTIALLILAPCVAQAGANDAADAKEPVRKAIHSFFELAETRDWDAVGKLLCDHFEMYTDGAATFGKKEYVAILKDEDLHVLSWKLEDLEIRLSSDATLAWGRYRGRFDTTSHGETQNVATTETLVLEKAADGWKVCHAHASILDLNASPDAPR